MARLRQQGIFSKTAENEAKHGAADELHKQAVKARESEYNRLRNETVAAAEAREKRRDARAARDESNNVYQSAVFELKYHEAKLTSLTKAKDTAGVTAETEKVAAIKIKLAAAKTALEAKRAALKTAREASHKATRIAARTRGRGFVHNKIAHKTEKIMLRAKNVLAALAVQAKHTGERIKSLETKVQKQRAALLDLQLKYKQARKTLRELRAKYKLKPLPEPVPTPASNTTATAAAHTVDGPVLEKQPVRAVDSSAKATPTAPASPALKSNAKPELDVADVI